MYEIVIQPITQLALLLIIGANLSEPHTYQLAGDFELLLARVCTMLL